jgi:maltodextrin utilization protein YvdJ
MCNTQHFQRTSQGVKNVNLRWVDLGRVSVEMAVVFVEVAVILVKVVVVATGPTFLVAIVLIIDRCVKRGRDRTEQ